MKPALTGTTRERRLIFNAMNSTRLVAASLLFFLVSCTSDPLLQLHETTETTLGPSGGVAKSADGRLELNFPLGALKEEMIITVNTIRDRTPAVPRALEPVVYEFGPNGLTFDHEVFIKMKVSGAGPDDAVAIANVDGPYPAVLESSLWSADIGVVQATLAHFSSYAAVTVYNPCAGLACGDTCTVCDPLNTSCVEPPPASKACNRSGLCVDSTVSSCPMPPVDAGVPDTGLPDSGQPDSGEEDSGVEPPDSGMPTCTETLTQNPQPVVDILIIMDNSASMSEEQTLMASSFDLLRTTLENNSTDFHVGVTTTDVDVTGAQGALIGTPTVLSSSTPNLAQAFASNVSAGIDGSGFEQGLEASRLALTPPINPGFLRDNSSLAVIYVSDEDDQSADTTAAYESFLLSVRDARRLQANAIIGPLPAGCTGTNGNAINGDRYDEVRTALGGVMDSICDASWPTALTNLGGPNFGYLYRFELSGAPASVSSVTIESIPVPPSDWSYDPVTHTIEFIENAVPGPGAEIVVVYGC